MEGNFQGRVVLFTSKVEHFIYTGKWGDSQMVTCFRNNRDIFIDQLPVSITKITTGRDEFEFQLVVYSHNFRCSQRGAKLLHASSFLSSHCMQAVAVAL